MEEKYIKLAEKLSRGAEVLPGGTMELAKKLKKSEEQGKPLRVKLGLDPTRPDLHLGHTVVMRKLRQFQEAGHQVVLIIGAATAMIGDPSGKSETRPSLSKEEVDENAKTYLDQMGKVVDVSKADVVNNADWLHKMQLADLLKLSSNITVAQMLVRDDFSKRYAEGKPISVHEFFYPLMQAYDSVVVDSDIELGGTDQRFNVLLGRDIQQAYGNNDPQMVMLLPLLEGTDGVIKMSKSYPDHCISLTDSPQDMLGKIMSIPDSLILRYYELLTDIEIKEIAGNPRDLKMKLAKTIVAEYYSQEEAEKAEQEFVNVFSKKGLPDVIDEYEVEEGKSLIDFIAENSKRVKSKSDVRRLLIGGGVQLDGEKILDVHKQISFKNLHKLKDSENLYTTRLKDGEKVLIKKDGEDFIILKAGKLDYFKLVPKKNK